MKSRKKSNGRRKKRSSRQKQAKGILWRHQVVTRLTGPARRRQRTYDGMYLVSFGKSMHLFMVQPSTVLGAGLGLFAAMDFPKDALLLEFTGRLFCNKNLTNKILKEPLYAEGARISKGFIIPVDKRVDIAYFANDGRMVKGQKTKQNARFVYDVPGQVWIRSTKRIQSGEEILIDYGPGYWAARAFLVSA